MGLELTISASEFKATCLDVFKRLASHRLTKVTVTRHGTPVAVLTPPPIDEAAVRAGHGSMAGAVTVPPGFDLTAPVFDGSLDAEAGLLHR